jgi:hypothetical protein
LIPATPAGNFSTLRIADNPGSPFEELRNEICGTGKATARRQQVRSSAIRRKALIALTSDGPQFRLDSRTLLFAINKFER